ncbi:hypothetical protein CEQ21_14235 [Niallia circulans]|uniref:Uncharacterized protein n=1 Tax=Niallia circulans TaxID=1397 RepID=A0A553SI59_NIACI|nr:hypothetical protein CEQ21_14235 [Niallia circulans]
MEFHFIQFPFHSKEKKYIFSIINKFLANMLVLAKVYLAFLFFIAYGITESSTSLLSLSYRIGENGKQYISKGELLCILF